MDSFLAFFERWRFLLVPVIVLLATLLVGFIIRGVLFSRLAHWAKKSKTQLDDIIIAVAKGPSIIWIVILAVLLATRFYEFPLNVASIIDKSLIVLGIISVTLVAANLAAKLIQNYSAKWDSGLPVTSLTQNVAMVVIFILGILLMLASLGIPITPMLATLGVGGLAVALALQDTLSNLFAGIYVSGARQIRVGDYIKLDSGEEGYVVDIHWRTTCIRVLSNNMVIVPNEKLSKAIVTNYYMPEKELSVLVNLNVHYKSDLQKVEQVTIETAKEVMREVQGGVPGFEPFIRYNNFGDSGIGFSVILRGKEFTDQYLLKHEFIKRLHDRYRGEGIVIPYPIRAINYDQEKAGN